MQRYNISIFLFYSFRILCLLFQSISEQLTTLPSFNVSSEKLNLHWILGNYT